MLSLVLITAFLNASRSVSECFKIDRKILVISRLCLQQFWSSLGQFSEKMIDPELVSDFFSGKNDCFRMFVGI